MFWYSWLFISVVIIKWPKSQLFGLLSMSCHRTLSALSLFVREIHRSPLALRLMSRLMLFVSLSRYLANSWLFPFFNLEVEILQNRRWILVLESVVLPLVRTWVPISALMRDWYRKVRTITSIDRRSSRSSNFNSVYLIDSQMAATNFFAHFTFPCDITVTS